jgi:hypothetical protein
MPCRSALPNTAGEGQMGSKKAVGEEAKKRSALSALHIPGGHATSPPTRLLPTWQHGQSQAASRGGCSSAERKLADQPTA